MSASKEIDLLQKYFSKSTAKYFKVFHSKVFLSKSIYSLQSEMNFPQEKIPPREMVLTKIYILQLVKKIIQGRAFQDNS